MVVPTIHRNVTNIYLICCNNFCLLKKIWIYEENNYTCKLWWVTSSVYIRWTEKWKYVIKTLRQWRCPFTNATQCNSVQHIWKNGPHTRHYQRDNLSEVNTLPNDIFVHLKQVKWLHVTHKHKIKIKSFKIYKIALHVMRNQFKNIPTAGIQASSLCESTDLCIRFDHGPSYLSR